MKNAILCLVLGIFVLGISACDSCKTGGDDDSADAAPADVAHIIKAAIQTGIAAIETGEALATLNNPPKFDACMIATGSTVGLEMALVNVDSIEAEAENPDGHLKVTGGPIDFTRCMSMEGKPDPWPPTKPNPQVEQMVKAGVPLALGIAKSAIEPKIPAEGPECIKGRVALAMMDAIGEAVTTTVIDGVNGKEVTAIPNFEADYSGCGLKFEEKAPEEPADAAPAADEGEGTE